MKSCIRIGLFAFCYLVVCSSVEAQFKGMLDATRNLHTHLRQEKLHVPLEDRYIGFLGAVSDDSSQTPTFFRAHFTVNAAGPSRLFLFGSGVATVFINGKLVQEFREPKDHSRFCSLPGSSN